MKKAGTRTSPAPFEGITIIHTGCWKSTKNATSAGSSMPSWNLYLGFQKSINERMQKNLFAGFFLHAPGGCVMTGMGEEQSERLVTYAFVDAANITYRDVEKGAWKIDLKRLIKYLRERFGASRVLFYSGYDAGNVKQVKLYRKLIFWGYELRLNTVKRFLDAYGKRYNKADVDSRLTFEIMRYLPVYDRAVMMTGDGDFLWVLQHIQQQKDKVWLLASPRKTAKELKQLFAGDFANLDSLRTALEHKKGTDSTNDSVPGGTTKV